MTEPAAGGHSCCGLPTAVSLFRASSAAALSFLARTAFGGAPSSSSPPGSLPVQLQELHLFLAHVLTQDEADRRLLPRLRLVFLQPPQVQSA